MTEHEYRRLVRYLRMRAALDYSKAGLTIAGLVSAAVWIAAHLSWR